MTRRLLLLAFVLFAGCSPSSGSVSGEVYFAGIEGEGKRASSVAVRLLREPDSLDARVGKVCTRYGEAIEALRGRLIVALNQATQSSGFRDGLQRLVTYGPTVEATRDSIHTLTTSTVEQVNNAIDALTVDSVVTGLEARYSFRNRAAGSYAVFARGDYGLAVHVWTARLTLAGNDSLVVNLGTREDRGFGFYCNVTASDLLAPTDRIGSQIAAAKITLQSLDATASAEASADARRRREAAIEQAGIDKAYNDSIAKEAELAQRARAYQESDVAARARALALTSVDVRPSLLSGSAQDGKLRGTSVPSGTVAGVRFIVEPDGSVSSIVVEPGVSSTMQAAVIAAIETRKYEPGKKDGKAVAVRMKQYLAVP